MQSVVQQIIFEDNLLKKLKATDVIINALENNIKLKVGAGKFQKYVHTLFADKEFIRKLTNLALMKSHVETALEYSGFDYISNPDYHYDEDMENRIIDIEKKLSVFLGNVLKEMSKGMEIA